MDNRTLSNTFTSEVIITSLALRGYQLFLVPMMNQLTKENQKRQSLSCLTGSCTIHLGLKSWGKSCSNCVTGSMMHVIIFHPVWKQTEMDFTAQLSPCFPLPWPQLKRWCHPHLECLLSTVKKAPQICQNCGSQFIQIPVKLASIPRSSLANLA